jgi:hypothetical protein
MMGAIWSWLQCSDFEYLGKARAMPRRTSGVFTTFCLTASSSSSHRGSKTLNLCNLSYAIKPNSNQNLPIAVSTAQSGKMKPSLKCTNHQVSTSLSFSIDDPLRTTFLPPYPPRPLQLTSPSPTWAPTTSHPHTSPPMSSQPATSSSKSAAPFGHSATFSYGANPSSRAPTACPSSPYPSISPGKSSTHSSSLKPFSRRSSSGFGSCSTSSWSTGP